MHEMLGDSRSHKLKENVYRDRFEEEEQLSAQELKQENQKYPWDEAG